MRILILNQFYAPDLSPTAWLAASLAEDRAARGDEVTVLTSQASYVAGPSGLQTPQNKKLHIRRLWSPKFGKNSHLRRLADYGAYYLLANLHALSLPRQDVVVALTTPPFIAVAGVLHKAAHPQTRLVLWNMDCYPDVIERYGLISDSGFVSFLLRRINRMIFERVDHLVGLDDAMIDLLRQRFAPRTLRSTVIPNWENRDFFPAPLLEAPAVPSAEHPFRIVYLGNAGYGHLFDTVLDAASALNGHPVEFIFRGGGSRWRELMEGARSRNLKNMVIGSYIDKKDTIDVMANAHCALITLRDDALGIMSPSKLHSNLAMGLPVIYVGPAGSNVDEAISRFGCGISLRHGQSAELAAFVRSLCDDPAALQRLRERARTAFDEAYCDRKTLPQFDKVLRDSS